MGRNVDSLTSTSKEVEVKEMESVEWIKLKRGPFYAAGTKGNWTITIAGCACCEKKFQTVESAQKYLDAKGWDLILTATSIYMEKVQQIKELRAKEDNE